MRTYNSRSAGNKIQFGYGWADLFNPAVSALDAGGNNVRLINSGCTALMYASKDANGRYLAPLGTPDALAQNADNNLDADATQRLPVRRQQ